MAFIDSIFRRVSRPGDASLADEGESRASAPRKISAPGKKKKQSGGGFYYWSFFIHKWAGLIGAAWLAVLGLTGFFLDHDSWRWLMQNKSLAFLTPASLDANSARGVARYLQIDPSDRSIQVTGGPRGLWLSRDGGTTWTATRFLDGDHPQILAIEPDPAVGWNLLWFASDNGVYVSNDQGATARQTALKGEYVTSLAAGSAPDELLAVIDKSKIVRFKTEEPAKIDTIELGPLGPLSRVTDVQLNRFVRELHFGKGLVGSVTSLLMNDIGGLGMFVLSLTGLLYWGLPKWWKHRAKGVGGASKATKAARRSTIVWLFRAHSATLGVASVLMLIYLVVTGIFIGHGRELGDWMKATRIPQAYLTPAFDGSSWAGWIDASVAYPGMPGAFTIGNRIGMFTTADNGRSWAREEDATGKPVGAATRLRRIDDKVLVSGGMAGPSLIRGADQVDHEVVVGGRGGNREAEAERMGGMDHSGTDHAHHGVNGGAGMSAGMARRAETAGMGGMEAMFMPSDVTRLGDNFVWKNSSRIYVTDADGKEIETFESRQPSDPGTPWFSWLLRVHMGTIFWSEWRWVNDIFAVLAVFLSVTGLIRWWRQKWM
ncbi:MAG: PepSY domain-containing protein [Methylocystis sp.]